MNKTLLQVTSLRKNNWRIYLADSCNMQYTAHFLTPKFKILVIGDTGLS